MNIYVIVLGTFLLVMMVVLGHHHRHSADPQDISTTGDPLVDKIEQYNKDKSHSMGIGDMSQGAGSALGGFQPLDANQMAAPAPAYANQEPYPQQNPADNSNNSYYPPPALGAPQSPLQQQQQAQPQSYQ